MSYTIAGDKSVRIRIAKPGPEDHDRGAEVRALALCEAGVGGRGEAR